jgi:hypothetical protein
MLRQEDDVEIHARTRQGWTISAIARHLDRDYPITLSVAFGATLACAVSGTSWPSSSPWSAPT